MDTPWIFVEPSASYEAAPECFVVSEILNRMHRVFASEAFPF